MQKAYLFFQNNLYEAKTTRAIVQTYKTEKQQEQVR